MEKNGSVIASLNANIERVRKSTGATLSNVLVVRGDVFTWHPSDDLPFDLVFCDPPYRKWEDWAESLFSLMDGWLSPTARVVLEQPSQLHFFPPGFERIKRLGRKKPHAPSLTIWKPSGLRGKNAS